MIRSFSCIITHVFINHKLHNNNRIIDVYLLSELHTRCTGHFVTGNVFISRLFPIPYNVTYYFAEPLPANYIIVCIISVMLP